ncbi:hypothetical protein JHK87_016044 [Glycine soja]|nr:hypothetical protein JHK87_016044 [Glycine soja]
MGSHNGINVPDANLVPISCTSDVINLMNLGHKNCAVGSTAMNDRSSRSHSAGKHQFRIYPDPELTLGLPVHTDFNALTIVLQSQVSGLQVIKDGKWIAVPVIPNAFVINLGDQIQGSSKSLNLTSSQNEVRVGVLGASGYSGSELGSIQAEIHSLYAEECKLDDCISYGLFINYDLYLLFSQNQKIITIKAPKEVVMVNFHEKVLLFYHFVLPID